MSCWVVLLAMGLLGCDKIPALAQALAPDAGEAKPAATNFAPGNDAALLYNLVGRWYPEEEIKRLMDRTLTPEQWCEREPAVIFVYPEKIDVRCKKGALQSAAIAKIERDKDGAINITMRTREDSGMRFIKIDAKGPKATISGSPCLEGRHAYGRFPEYDVMTREILGGRRCAQITDDALKEEAEKGAK